MRLHLCSVGGIRHDTAPLTSTETRADFVRSVADIWLCSSATEIEGLLPLQFVERDRQVAYPLSGGMIDRISDRGWYPDNTDLA